MLNGLKPLREYCLQVRAHLIWTHYNISRPGHLSNVSCYETTMDGNTCLLASFLSWDKNPPQVVNPGLVRGGGW